MAKSVKKTKKTTTTTTTTTTTAQMHATQKSFLNNVNENVSAQKDSNKSCDANKTPGQQETQDERSSSKPTDTLGYESSFSLLSKRWFNRRGLLANKNKARVARNQATIKKHFVDDELMSVESAYVNDNTIKESNAFLIKKMEDEKTIKGLAELHALTEVGKFIINDGVIVSTQEAGKVYFTKKTNFLGY
jgi:hypothetical protein